MERLKPVEFVRDTAGMIANAGRFALHQVTGGGWAELAETAKPTQASITYYRTPEQLEFEIPSNIEVGTE